MAEWIHCKGKSHIWYCSNCGEKVNYNNAQKLYTKAMKPIEEVNRYCRHCGEKMSASTICEEAQDIPVGWMIDRANDTERAPLYRRYAQMLYEEWQKE